MAIDWGSVTVGLAQVGGNIYLDKKARQEERKRELRESILMQNMYGGDQKHLDAASKSSPGVLARRGFVGAGAGGISGLSTCGASSSGDWVFDLSFVSVMAAIAVVGAATAFFPRKKGK